MNLFFTADPHFGHRGILDYCNRPWDTVDDMRAGLVDNWNGTVKPQDTVYILGDFSLHPRELDVVPLLNGTIHFVDGNHDAVWPGHRQSHKHFQVYTDAFASVASFRRMRHNHAQFMLSHFPYSQGAPNERYVQYRLPDHGIPLLHGHVHQQWVTNRSLNGTPMVNVGVDVWDYKPVHIDQILALLADFPDGSIAEVK